MMILVRLLPAGGRHAARRCVLLGAAGARAWSLLSLGMLALFLDLEHKRPYVAALHDVPDRLADVVGRVDPACWSIRRSSRPRSLRPPAWLRASRLALERALADLRRPRAASSCASIGVANIVLGVALGIYTGILLSSLGARPLWNSALLGPLFLASGLSAAAAFVHLVARRRGRARTAGARRQRASSALELVAASSCSSSAWPARARAHRRRPALLVSAAPTPRCSGSASSGSASSCRWSSSRSPCGTASRTRRSRRCW